MKYYIQYGHPLDTKADSPAWDFIIEIIQERGEEIVLVEETMEYDVNLPGKHTREPKFTFNLDHAKATRITRRPYLIKEEYLSVAFHYPVNQDIIAEMRSEWMGEIAENGLPPHFFVIKDNKEKIILGITPWGIFGLFYEREADVLKNLGMSLEEWDVLLNDVV
jgi:hypothetical protein